MPAKNLLHDLRLARAQQTIIHENAGQLIADGLVQQRRRDAGINPAAEVRE